MDDSVPTQRTFKIRLPMRIATSKRKLTALNLNVYRNLHHRSLHAQKKNFSREVGKLVKDLPFMETVTLHYDIYPKTKRRLDIMNVGSIVDKYFSDTLVEKGIIPDDDLKHVTFVSFGFGGMSKQEHVLVTITETSKPKRSKEPMRILLDQSDIQTALKSHVETMGISGATGVKITVKNGEVVAEVLIGETENTKTITTTKTKSRSGRPKGSKNKPKEPEVTPDVAETGTSGSAGNDTGTGADADEENETTSEDTTSKTESDSGKNLFGEEESESSNEGGSPEEETPVDTKPVKKSSIFDT